MSRGWLKASVASAIAQIARMACGLAVLKIVVMELGVDGIGKLGHFMNLLSILFVFAGGGINVGIAKYVAQYQDSESQLQRFLAAAWNYSVVASSLLAMIFIAGAHEISTLLFGDGRYQDLIIFVGLAQFSFAFVNFVTGVVNGLRETQAFSRISTIGSLIGITPCYFLVSRFHLQGAVIALVLVQGCMLIPAAFELGRFVKFRPKLKPHFGEMRQLGQFSLMQLFSVATMPIVEIYIRTELVKLSGWDGAGVWQGVQRLSYASLSLFTSFLSVYYMPTLSRLVQRPHVVSYVFKTLAGVMLTFAVGACFIYFFRNLVFSLFLDKNFHIESKFLFYRLVGDLFRISAYVIGFAIVAKAATKLYVVGEIAQSAIYVSMFSLVAKADAGHGVFMAYAVSNFLYFMLCAIGLLIYAGAKPGCQLSNPKLSVVVSCYGQRDYISTCLDSILAQQLDCSYEIVISDDCSPDGTREIVDRYGREHPTIIRVLPNTENVGAARNYFRAHNAARGAYVAHIDGDDVMLPGKLQRQVDVLDGTPECVLVNHRARYFSDDRTYETETGEFPGGQELVFYSRAEQARWGTIAVHSSYMYRADARKTREYQGDFMEWYFTMEYLGRPGATGCFINSVLVEYRCNQTSQAYLASRRGRERSYRILIGHLLDYFSALPELRRDIYAHALLNILTYHRNVRKISWEMLMFLLRNIRYLDLTRVRETIRIRGAVGPQKRIR